MTEQQVRGLSLQDIWVLYGKNMLDRDILIDRLTARITELETELTNLKGVSKEVVAQEE